jgi:NADPH-dependent curcumin reductase CurA
MRTTEIRLAMRPAGAPTLADFALVETVLAEPGAGQILVRNRFMVLSAVMRTLLADGGPMPGYQVGQPLFGQAVGEVVSSSDPAVPVGATVAHPAGWREHALLDAGQARVIDADSALPTLSSGFTAYVGLRVAGLRPGDTVYVSSAAGAVGSMAAHLATALGAGRVIGSAGSAAKVAALTERFGYDAGFDYRSGQPADGIDVALDNVGGGQLKSIVARMALRGRVALCGALAQQLGNEPDPELDLLTVVGKRLSLRGFITSDHRDYEPEYRELIRARGITPPHTLIEGLDAAPQALLDLFAGQHTGLVVVTLDGGR